MHKLTLALQPVVDAKTRDLRFYECLARLRRPDGTLLPIGPYVESIEREGRISEFDVDVLKLGLEILHTRADVRISINVSRLSALSSSWLETVEDGIRGNPSIRNRLIVEITETATVNDIRILKEFADRVRELGLTLAVDDFGAGYTSALEFDQLKPHILKLDGSLASKVPDNERAVQALKQIITKARDHNMKVIAEWITDHKTADAVTELGVDLLQGFLFGRPVLADDMLE